MSNSEKDAFEEEHDDAAEEDRDEILEKIVLPTLPSAFKSLVGRTVEIDTEEPRCVIELLGDLLGIRDYEINKAAFWFLDALALQVLRYKNHLNDCGKSALISWLAGEMMLIRDRKFLREDFFKEMRMLFLYVAKKISNGDQLPHWELLMNEYPKITSENAAVDESVERKVNSIISTKLSENELIAEADAPLEKAHPVIGKAAKICKSRSKQSVMSSQEEPISFTNSLIKKKSQMSTDTDVIIESSDLMNSIDVLDVIIEATYGMYANELRYALIHAVFVTLIPVEIYHIRHTLRIPRRIKPAHGSFDIKLYKRLKKSIDEEKLNNSKKRKGKKARATDINAEGFLTPLSLMNDEEILDYNRRFILPLIESKEATRMFDIHMDTQRK